MAEERLAATKDRKVELEERMVAADDPRMVEKALKFMFMDTSGLYLKSKAYVELCRDEMIMKKQMFMKSMMMGGMEVPWAEEWEMEWVAT